MQIFSSEFTYQSLKNGAQLCTSLNIQLRFKIGSYNGLYYKLKRPDKYKVS